MKKTKNILILSLVLNIIFVIASSAYIIKKITIPVSQGTSFHAIKKSEFSVLPVSERDIVFAGDSITNYCNWSELFGDDNIKNRGIPGDKTNGLIDNLDNIINGQPKKVFLMIGINDLSNGTTIDDTLSNYKTIISDIKNKSSNTNLIIQSVLPINTDILKNTKATNDEIKQFNSDIKSLANNNNLQYIDLHSKFIDENGQLKQDLTIDGIHLSGNGYLLWKSLIQNEVDAQ